MAAFTASDVKELREKTGIGMMDCKNALTEANGDMEKAIEILREKGLAASVKKGSRIAAEGMVVSIVKGNVGAIVEVNAETDFVAKNTSFQAFVNGIAELILDKNPTDIDALMALPFEATTVEDALRERVLKIGENIKIRRFYRAEGTVASYVHAGGGIGVLVEFDTDLGKNPVFDALATDVSLQIAAMSPQYLDKTSVDTSFIEKEKEILLAQAINEGKPKEIAEKMVIGRVNKMFSDICLVDQAFIKDDKISVLEHVNNVAKELGGKIVIKKFTRYEKGEGIEKRDDNFADEVASMVK